MARRSGSLVAVALLVSACAAGATVGEAGPTVASGGSWGTAIATRSRTDAAPTGNAASVSAAAQRSAPVVASASAAPSSAAVFGTAPVGRTTSAMVSRVVDGDTIEVSIGGALYKVRYIGVDTPETVKPGTPVQWMGPEASAANKGLVAGKSVVLERDVSETDMYGRLLRYVWLHDARGWTMVNLRLVELGYAQVSTWPPDVRYVDLFLAAQAKARDAEVGLWGPEPSGVASATPAAPRPTVRTTPRATAPPTPDRTAPPARSGCDPSYPTVCIPPAPPDLNCKDVTYRNFRVLPPDPHRFDGDHDGIGCES